MSDVNALFKKKKGKKKAMDLNAATNASSKKQTKTKAEKQKEAAEDDEWKTETKKTVVLTNGKAVEEFGKKYNEEVVYEEDLDIGTKLDIDETRKMLQDVIQRSAEVDQTPKNEPEPEPEKAKPLQSLSLEDRFAQASTTSKYMAKGPVAPKKSLEEEYPSLDVAVAKSNPTPLPKKNSKFSTSTGEDLSGPSSTVTPEVVPETIFRSDQLEEKKETSPPLQNAPLVKNLKNDEPIMGAVSENEVAMETTEVKKEEVVSVKKEKKKKKKGAAFEI